MLSVEVEVHVEFLHFILLIFLEPLLFVVFIASQRVVAHRAIVKIHYLHHRRCRRLHRRIVEVLPSHIGQYLVVVGLDSEFLIVGDVVGQVVDSFFGGLEGIQRVDLEYVPLHILQAVQHVKLVYILLPEHYLGLARIQYALCSRVCSSEVGVFGSVTEVDDAPQRPPLLLCLCIISFGILYRWHPHPIELNVIVVKAVVLSLWQRQF